MPFLRILAKYYDMKATFPTSVEEKKFEKNLFNKTHKVSRAEIRNQYLWAKIN